VSGQSIVEEYLALSRDTDADLVAMQVGDFYEFFADGAELVAEELDLKISQKSSHGSDYPMAGVPVSELTPYLRQLTERGYRVAVADQHETDDGHGRRIERIVTPGTVLDTTGAEAQYLAALVTENEKIGVALADVTTGRFHVTSVADEDAALAELYRFDPEEVLPGPELRETAFPARARERTGATVTEHDAAAFAPGRATHTLKEQFGANAAESVGLDDPAAKRAAGAALDYVAATGGVVGAFSRLRPYRSDDHVALDATTQRNLELVESMGEGGATLFDTIDHTETAAGGRLLREWLCRPRGDTAEIQRRSAAVAALADAALGREGIRETLDGTYDLERLASKAVHGSADARDCQRIRETLAVLPELEETVAAAPALAGSPVAERLEDIDGSAADALRAEIADALVDDPPASVSSGGLFQKGYHEELDELIARHEETRSWLDGLAAREKERLGVTHLQVDRNKTDGYYIQIGKSEADAAPEEYREVKTLKNSRRFVTEALEEKEREMLRIEERRGELERELFDALRERIADAASRLRAVGSALAELDALGSLATHAVENGWVRPTVYDGNGLDIVAGRHPVVEQTVEFVPNGVRFDDERGFLLVTGPNMSGKSTYMRQAALIVLLAQVGSFVPADSADVGLVDGIYTRVGALDELAQGRSTFMVEMGELSNILHSATEDSLVILDEVGRGTATYDGISIAWAATEYLHNEIRANTLFATHYHELTALADHLPRVANVHVAVDETGEDVTFLRSVEEGPTDRSYGVHVADLAGVPEPVVERAGGVLERLREEKAVEARGAGSASDEPTQAVFDVGSGEFRRASSDGGRAKETNANDGRSEDAERVLDALRELDVNRMSPVDLMAEVQSLQEELD